MADDKLVEREMLTNSYVNGTDVKPGDVVHITEAQAKAFEESNPPAVAEVGHLDKLRDERREAEEALREREAELAEHRNEQARLRGLHAQGLSGATQDDQGGSVADDTSRKARDEGTGDPDPTAGAARSSGSKPAARR